MSGSWYFNYNGLVGGTESKLDSINGAVLKDSDFSLAFDGLGDAWFHALDSDSGAAESSPDVIAPDNNAANKRWILCGLFTGRFRLLNSFEEAFCIYGNDGLIKEQL